ncbi:MAG TPA: uroporphyrinogen decarboxylase family protein [Candidatus Latescibacteria bacterium]|nr:uroporphyrinogen decarboxylase family protein [Candidatus Latescibacterota bacterium]
MTTRERFHATMNFQPFDRLPILEWAGWWDQTIARWHTEGLPADLADRYDICRHFGLDIYKQDWFGITKPGFPSPKSHGAGVIETEADYDRVREFLYPDNPVDPRRWEALAAEQATGEVVLWFSLNGFFWFPRTLLGIQRHLLAFYDQKELMHRINTDLLEWNLKVIDQLCAVCTPDWMTFAEDMSYNYGSMLSKQAFDEFMLPYYRQIVPKLKERGIITIIDSDGDITVPAHWFEEAGLEGILPLERQAGVDIAKLRREHPRMRFIGHFDKMTQDKGEDVMRAEFERLIPTAAKGGFLPSCDHQTPPGVSYEDYKVYIRLFQEYGEKAGKMSRGLAG